MATPGAVLDRDPGLQSQELDPIDQFRAHLAEQPVGGPLVGKPFRPIPLDVCGAEIPDDDYELGALREHADRIGSLHHEWPSLGRTLWHGAKNVGHILAVLTVVPALLMPDRHKLPTDPDDVRYVLDKEAELDANAAAAERERKAFQYMTKVNIVAAAAYDATQTNTRTRLGRVAEANLARPVSVAKAQRLGILPKDYTGLTTGGDRVTRQEYHDQLLAGVEAKAAADAEHADAEVRFRGQAIADARVKSRETRAQVGRWVGGLFRSALYK